MMSKRAGKPKTSRSLAATLVVAFLALTLAALLVTTISVFFFFFRAIQESVNSRQQLTAKEAANTVAGFVQEKFSELEATVKIGEPTLASQQEQRNALGNLLGLVPAFRQSILFNAQDQELVNVSRISQIAAEQLLARVGGDLFSQVRQGNRYVSPVYIDEQTSEPMIILAVPATDAFGDFQGTLLAEVNLKFMWDLVDRLQVGETGLAYVVDKQGNLLALGDISRVLRGENVGQLDVVGEFMRNPVPVGKAATSVVQGINGTTVVGTYVPLGMPDWAVVTELPLAEAFRPGIQSTAILGAVMLALAMLVGLVAVYIARRLAAPLLSLTETATRITGGEMDVQAAAVGPAEVASLAAAFNMMTTQLRELIGSLEQRVTGRTRGLQAAAEVAHAATSVLDPDELLRQTVDLVRERLDLYYVGLFLLDEEGRFAVLRAGTGEAGQVMLAQDHKLEVGGESMIGQCVAGNQARVALDVGQDPHRFENPLLPATRSELALPLHSRGRVIGAMTVQSARPTAFDEADITVMQTMADQVAVAIDNAHLFAQTKAALTDLETTQRHYLGQAWATYGASKATSGYEQTGASLVPLTGELSPEAQRAVAEGRTLILDGASNEKRPDAIFTLVTPILLRNQPLGALGFQPPTGGKPWSSEEIALIETVAEQFALAADNLRLLDETQRRATRERMIGDITARMRQTLDMETVLRTAADEMYAALGLDEVVIRLVPDETNNRSTD
jgi:GAF domain-containing protein/HAMP domain-containing protein